MDLTDEIQKLSIPVLIWVRIPFHKRMSTYSGCRENKIASQKELMVLAKRGINRFLPYFLDEWCSGAWISRLH